MTNNVRFNKKAGRYIVLNALAGHRAGIAQNVKAITDTFLNGDKKDTDTLLKKVADEVRYSTTVEYIVGKGGVNTLSIEDVAIVNSILKSELLLNFGTEGSAYGLQEVISQYENGEISDAQLSYRLQQYVKGSRKAYFRGVDTRTDLPYMGRTLHGDNHCNECVQYEAAGVQPKGVLPLPGELCSCKSNCNCTVKYYTEKQYKLWLNKQLEKAQVAS
jgi:hypothetical protein